jgi:hypothetical protein
VAIVSGTNGSVTNASGYSAGITAWTADITIAELDITSWDDATAGVIWREFVAGVREWTGTITARWDATSNITTGIGSELSVSLLVDGTKGITGEIIVTGISASVEMESVAGVSFTFRGAGAPNVSTS